MKHFNASSLFILTLPAVALLFVGCSKSESDNPDTTLDVKAALKSGLVIRAGQCSATAFKNGSGVHVSGDGDTISGLSVNCTTQTSDKAKYTNYLTGITGYNQYCVSTVAGLNGVGAKVEPDPLPNNADHCLLSGKASKISGKLAKYP
ncbi:hypothetical protein [Enterovibrio sp. 27052020O]|uniref:hypothetical protein n=1 Tax=Enterovibrio sp. 27052020O TaxID=3241166 RepID=UPI003890E76E